MFTKHEELEVTINSNVTARIDEVETKLAVIPEI